MDIERFVSKLLGPPQRVNARIPVSSYRERWTVINRNHLKVYLDHFVSDDWSRDLEDKPKQFFSVGVAEFVEAKAKSFELLPSEVVWMLLITRPSKPD